MKLRTLLIFGIGVLGGMYLATDDGKKTQKKIKEYTVSLKPVVKDLLSKTDKILDDVVNLKSDELKANIEKRIYDLKNTLSTIKSEDVSAAAKKAIKEATTLLRTIRAEINLSPKATSKRVKYEKMSVVELKKIARNKKIQLQPNDKKADIIDKLIQHS